MPDTYVLRSRTSAPRPFKIDYAGELNEAQYAGRDHARRSGAGDRRRGQRQDAHARLPRRAARRARRRARARSCSSRSRARPPRRCSAARPALVGADCERVAGGTFHSFANLVLRRHGAPTSASMPRLHDPRPRRLRGRASSCSAPRSASTARSAASREEADDRRALQHGGEPSTRGRDARRARLRAPRRPPRGPRAPRARGTGPTSARRTSSTTTTCWSSCATCCATQPDVAAQPRARATATSWSTSTRTRTASRPRSSRRSAATHDNVMAVGDDAQSIYSFRGANFRNIMDFPKPLPRHAPHHARGELPLDAADPRSRERDHRAGAGEATRRCCARAAARATTADPRAAPTTESASRASSRSASSSCARRASRSTRSPSSSARASTPSISSSSSHGATSRS